MCPGGYKFPDYFRSLWNMTRYDRRYDRRYDHVRPCQPGLFFPDYFRSLWNTTWDISAARPCQPGLFFQTTSGHSGYDKVNRIQKFSRQWRVTLDMMTVNIHQAWILRNIKPQMSLRLKIFQTVEGHSGYDDRVVSFGCRCSLLPFYTFR
jgi:hypothetical protein